MMLEPSREVPGHIAMLLNERIPFDDPIKARRILRSMLPELRKQAIASSGTPEYAEPVDRRFRVVLNEGLDLFSRSGACNKPKCRVSYAQQIARSISLMADEVVMNDLVGVRILELKRATDADLELLLLDSLILKMLAPLVEAQLLRFQSASIALCSSCLAVFESQVAQITDVISEELSDQFTFEHMKDGSLHIDTGSVYSPPIYRVVTPSSSRKNKMGMVRWLVGSSVRSALWDARTAAHIGGAVFSNSRASISAIMKAEARSTDREHTRVLDLQRAASLPFVSGLTIPQTLELRAEASRALPQLREFLARHLSARSFDGPGTTDSEEEYVLELREQSEAVKAELEIVTGKTSRLGRAALGMASLGICALGLAIDPLSAMEGVAQLLGTLGMIHQLNVADSHHEQSLQAKPGYVLVKAEQILAHGG